MDVNRIVADIINREGISQKQLADRVGVSRQAISQMVNGNDMKVSTLLAILNVLGYSIQVVKDGGDDE